MKTKISLLKISTIEDVNRIKNSISILQGVIACKINFEKQEVEVVYDDVYLTEDKIKEAVEDEGYIVR
ncbi:MAG: heavy-metal-associated domain-containing protein [Clostridiaceae bacterium]